ncbi:hypothetical protein [Cellulomonas endometrii]|uniref:hypothetical protein n=1 Tax=Cellulomonas endometrii TaxID=3036301 RepID=UPI0024AE4CB1|nr:hypothetical protein [Cellulomonas endometrii]
MTLKTVDPREWEQLGGYLLRVADAWWSSVKALLQSTARWTNLPMPGDLRDVSGFPDDDVIEAVTRVFGCSDAEVRAMTMYRFPPGLFGRPGHSGTAGADPRSPSLINGGVYCAPCVADRHWDVRWRTGLSVVCVKHREYVRARCPSCARVVSPESVAADLSRTRGLLIHGKSGVSGCPVHLDAYPVAVSTDHLRVQALIDELLAAASGGSFAAAARCRDVLRWAEWIHRCHGDATSLLTGGMVNSEGPDLAELIGTSLRLTNLTPERAARDPEVVRAVLRQATSASARGAPPRYAPYGAEVDSVLAAHRIATSRPIPLRRSPASLREDGEHGRPQVIPLSEFGSPLRSHVDFLTLDRGRVLTAICAAMPPDNTAWGATAAALRLPTSLGRRASVLVSLLDHLERADAFWSAVEEYRARMTAREIDFEARAERVLRDDGALAAARRSWPPLANEAQDVLRQWLLERWACQYIATLPLGLAGRRTAMHDVRPRIDGLVAEVTPVEHVWNTWSPEGRNRAAR